MHAQRKPRWRRQIDWLLFVTYHIVELVPSQKVGNDWAKMEVLLNSFSFCLMIMITQQHRDLLINIPALCKLDAMLIGYLDYFKDHIEFWYVQIDKENSKKGNT
ncbi:hypothetical protein IEQ34_009061 [Dendrobium chrysotoxum]|uniref:PRONE domain-containing protein n=1 Tax=Dendrobium chrysotoxum TaxID=161865 RepID=A0AAV7GXN7_DENCH|nr:hypothetical protein IEQ34_009061 [Dendrobium chrysotoxum]